MLSLLPVSWARLIDPGLTVIGAVFYLGYGIRVWRSRPGWLKLTYVAGGAILSLYEVHMVWWIEAIGLWLIMTTVVGGSDHAHATAGQVPLEHGPSGS